MEQEALEFLNQNYNSLESLDQLDQSILGLESEIAFVDSEIKSVVRQQAEQAEQAKIYLTDVNQKSNEMAQLLRTVQKHTSSAESLIKASCTEVKALDTAKKNITFSITSLNRLVMLIHSIENFSQCCIEKKYLEAAHLIQATDELLHYFKDYQTKEANTPEIQQVKTERDRLCKNLRLQILEDYGQIQKGGLGPQQLQQACYVMDALGEAAINDLRQWYTQHVLIDPYQNLFGPEKSESSFENTKRRFAWFRRTQKEVQQLVDSVFPQTWQMKELLTWEFCRVTKLHLDSILSVKSNELDVSLIIETMQSVIEFENELQTKTKPANQSLPDSNNASSTNTEWQQITVLKPRFYKFTGCISQCFEPYLQSYSEQEQKKILADLELKCTDDQPEPLPEQVVFLSSLHLFKNIRMSYQRCITFSKSKTLLDLVNGTFKNCLKFYAQLLRKKLPTKALADQPQTNTSSLMANAQFQADEKVLQQACYIVNTCDYCLEMIPKVEQQAQDAFDDQFYSNQIDLSKQVEPIFHELINAVVQKVFVVAGIEAPCEQVYSKGTGGPAANGSQGMGKINWATFAEVVETQYSKGATQIVSNQSNVIRTNLNPVYFTLYANKVAQRLPTQFLSQIYKLKKLNEVCAHQFQLDLEELKNELMQIYGQNEEPPVQFQQTVRKSIAKVSCRIKVLGYPESAIRDAYNSMVDEPRSEQELNLLLALRGQANKSNTTTPNVVSAELLGRQMMDFLNSL